MKGTCVVWRVQSCVFTKLGLIQHHIHPPNLRGAGCLDSSKQPAPSREAGPGARPRPVATAFSVAPPLRWNCPPLPRACAVVARRFAEPGRLSRSFHPALGARGPLPADPFRAPRGLALGLQPGHGKSEGSAGPRAPGCGEAHRAGRARSRASGPRGGPAAGLVRRSWGEGEWGARAAGVRRHLGAPSGLGPAPALAELPGTEVPQAAEKVKSELERDPASSGSHPCFISPTSQRPLSYLLPVVWMFHGRSHVVVVFALGRLDFS